MVDIYPKPFDDDNPIREVTDAVLALEQTISPWTVSYDKLRNLKEKLTALADSYPKEVRRLRDRVTYLEERVGKLTQKIAEEQTRDKEIKFQKMEKKFQKMEEITQKLNERVQDLEKDKQLLVLGQIAFNTEEELRSIAFKEVKLNYHFNPYHSSIPSIKKAIETYVYSAPSKM